MPNLKFKSCADSIGHRVFSRKPKGYVILVWILSLLTNLWYFCINSRRILVWIVSYLIFIINWLVLIYKHFLLWKMFSTKINAIFVVLWAVLRYLFLKIFWTFFKPSKTSQKVKFYYNGDIISSNDNAEAVVTKGHKIVFVGSQLKVKIKEVQIVKIVYRLFLVNCYLLVLLPTACT